MKKILFFAVTLCSLLISCGDAAEDREKMHNRAKVFQDSIANFIRTSMAEAEAPGPMMGPVPQASAIPQPSLVPSQTPVPMTPSTTPAGAGGQK